MKEVFRTEVPWMRGTDLVVLRRGPRWYGLKMARIQERQVCEFRDGTISWTSASPLDGMLSPAEKLCLAVLPKDFALRTDRFREVMADPFWQGVLDQMMVNDVMEQ